MLSAPYKTWNCISSVAKDRYRCNFSQSCRSFFFQNFEKIKALQSSDLCPKRAWLLVSKKGIFRCSRLRLVVLCRLRTREELLQIDCNSCKTHFPISIVRSQPVFVDGARCGS